MNLIYDQYPHTVVLNGTEREIVTDFKDWLRFVDMLKAEELSNEEKFQTMLNFYFDELPAGDLIGAFKPLEGFFRMDGAYKKEPDTGNDGNHEELPGDERPAVKPLYDFSFDAGYIISGFWHDYRIDLTTAHMHWWKFRILLDGLSSETEFKQRVMYRNTDASQIKDSNERNRILRIQRRIAIPQPKPTDFEIGDMFA